MQHPEELCYFIDWRSIGQQGYAPEWLQKRIHNDLASLDELQGECAEVFTEALERRYGAPLFQLRAAVGQGQSLSEMYHEAQKSLGRA